MKGGLGGAGGGGGGGAALGLPSHGGETKKFTRSSTRSVGAGGLRSQISEGGRGDGDVVLPNIRAAGRNMRVDESKMRAGAEDEDKMRPYSAVAVFVS